MNIGEFFVQLGVNADNTTLKDFIGTLGDLSLDAAGAIATMGEITYKLSEIAKEAMNAAVGFDMFSTETGLSWQELQRWQIAAQQVNVGAESVTQSVSNLEKQMTELRLGHGNLFPWQALGLDPRSMDAFKVLDQLRGKIKNLDRPMAANLIQQLGLTPDMLKILELSDRDFQKLTTSIRGMTTEQEQDFLKAKQRLVQFGLQLKYLGVDIVSHLVEDFDRLYTNISKVKGLLPLLGIVAAGLAAAFAPLTAGLVALLLVLDDLAVYFSGGKSLFGYVLDKLKGLTPQQNPLTAGNGNLGKMLGVASKFAPMLGITGAAAAAGNLINNTFNIMSNPLATAQQIAAEVVKKQKQSMRAANNQSNNGGY